MPYPDRSAYPDRFYPVVDSVAWVARLAALGVGTVQLRAKDLTHAQAVALVREALAAAGTAKLVVNDYWQAAIDAGLGAPSHAAHALELGYDAVLLNTAIAKAADPVAMASAFRSGVEAGRLAYEAGLMEARDFASPSTPVIGTPFWHAVS